MTTIARCALLMFFSSSAMVQACPWQVNLQPWTGDMKHSGDMGRIGQPKGGAKYLVSDMDGRRFTACIKAFAQRFGFKLASAWGATLPHSYSFGDIWFYRGDGVALNVSTVTGPGKFHVFFYAQDHDVKSAAAARSAFLLFVEGMTDFDRVEVYPEVPDLK